MGRYQKTSEDIGRHITKEIFHWKTTKSIKKHPQEAMKGITKHQKASKGIKKHHKRAILYLEAYQERNISMEDIERYQKALKGIKRH